MASDVASDEGEGHQVHELQGVFMEEVEVDLDLKDDRR